MKITLITACYNSAATIRTAIESVIAQKGVDVEYIIVDGGSTDGTVDLIKDFAARWGQSPDSPLGTESKLGTVSQKTVPDSHFAGACPHSKMVPDYSQNAPEMVPDSFCRMDNCNKCCDNGRFSLKWMSEPDKGMYDAINKGIKMATGDVIGILNADDVLAADETLAHIAQAFGEWGMGNGEWGMGNGEWGTYFAKATEVETGNGERVDCVYADIRFVKEGDSVEALRSASTVRYCSAAKWRPWMFRFGAMVPHPSFYVRRECFERLGGYSLDYRICADFELELRYLYLAKLRAAYLPECVVVMRMGGASTSGWRSTVEINLEDLRALRSHGIWSCLPLIYLKYLFKIWGFVFKRR